MIILNKLSACPGIRHGFLSREGGVSGGLYASLNCGFGSGDEAALVAENRRRALIAADPGATALVTVYQIHSPAVAVVDQPWQPAEAPQADAMVTMQRGLGLGVLSADCVPVLLADPQHGVIGAAHSGWGGTLGGVLEATVQAMIDLGAQPRSIRAGIGPAIQQASYEVGDDFLKRFAAGDRESSAFFKPASRPGHAMFDLPGYVEHRLRRVGISEIDRSPLDTYANEARFFSFRRATHRGETAYGRAISIISLTG